MLLQQKQKMRVSTVVYDGGKEVCDYFEKCIVHPIRNADKYHPQLAPIQYMHAFLGREGHKKCEIIETLAAKFDITVLETISVTIGKCREALTKLQSIASVTNNIEEDRNRFIIILDHADVLVYEPDDYATMLDATGLLNMAKQSGIFVVALFDRHCNSYDPSKHSAIEQELFHKFYTQFNLFIYVPAPDPEYRAQLFRSYFDGFKAHRPQCNIQLSDNDFNQLADCSVYTSASNMMDFLQRFGAYVVRQEDKLNDITLETITNAMPTVGVDGVPPHIMRDDPRTAENEFALACGKGPTASKRQKRN